jgi:hypothetical protein
MAERSLGSKIAKGVGDALLAPGRALAGAIDKNNKKKAEEKAVEIAKKNAGKTATQPETTSHIIRDVNGKIVADRGEPMPQLNKQENAAPVKQAAPVQKQYTFQDVLNEVGEDPKSVRAWLASHPGYKPGELTNKWLAEHPVAEEAPVPTEESKADVIEPSEVEDSTENTEAAKPTEDKTVEDIVGSDKEQKKQINKAAQSIWDAVARGDMDPQTGGYFLMDALMKTANNKQRRDSNYIENLSRAAHGDTILGYDVSNDEKSKYEEMVQNPALERANAAADIESTSNAQTAADLSTAQTQQQYGEAVGPEGLAQTAATQSAINGNFDTVANAFASGDKSQVEAALNTELQNPQIQTQLANLEKQLKEGTLDADIMAAKLQNQMSQQQIELMKANAKLLGFEGDLKSVLANAIKNAGTALSSITGGGDIMQNAGSLGMLVLLAKLGVM